MCPPKPPDLSLRLKAPGGRVSKLSLSPVSGPSSSSEALNSSFRNPLQRRNPVIPDTVKLPPGLVHESPSLSPAQTHSPPAHRTLRSLLRRREQHGRRADGTQSVYLDSPESGSMLSFSSWSSSTTSSSCSISMVTPSPQDVDAQPCNPRRFSDPDIPYMDAEA